MAASSPLALRKSLTSPPRKISRLAHGSSSPSSTWHFTKMTFSPPRGPLTTMTNNYPGPAPPRVFFPPPGPPAQSTDLTTSTLSPPPNSLLQSPRFNLSPPSGETFYSPSPSSRLVKPLPRRAQPEFVLESPVGFIPSQLSYRVHEQTVEFFLDPRSLSLPDDTDDNFALDEYDETEEVERDEEEEHAVHHIYANPSPPLLQSTWYLNPPLIEDDWDLGVDADVEDDDDDDELTFSRPLPAPIPFPHLVHPPYLGACVKLVPLQHVFCTPMGSYIYTASAVSQDGSGTVRLVCVKKVPQARKHQWDVALAQTEFEVFRRLGDETRGPICGATFVQQAEACVIDNHDYVFVMDYGQRDLWQHIRDMDQGLRLTRSQVWLAQIATGIQYLHSIGIIHRDIKPENILVDWKGNLRIFDYGLAYVSSSRKPLDTRTPYAYRNCGTPGFRAPEVFRKMLMRKFPTVPDDMEQLTEFAVYGLAIDYWSLGYLAFELGSVDVLRPFTSQMAYREFLQLRNSKSRHAIDERWFIPNNLPLPYRDLIWGLLSINPKERFGFEDLYHHPFFRTPENFNVFDGLWRRALRKPITPYPADLFERTLNSENEYIATAPSYDGREGIWIHYSSSIFKFHHF